MDNSKMLFLKLLRVNSISVSGNDPRMSYFLFSVI